MTASEEGANDEEQSRFIVLLLLGASHLDVAPFWFSTVVLWWVESVLLLIES